MALVRVNIPSPSYSNRSGSVRIIVLHTAEGARTYQSLGSFFANRQNAVSSHVGIDDTPNTVGQYVPRSGSAWTQANYNSASVAAELCAFAAWSAAEWARHPNMLANTAQWIKEEAAAFGLPIVRLSPAQAQGGGRGVCQHIDLGAGGGGHVDCGPAFPMDQVIAMAQSGAPIVPGDDLPLNDADKLWIAHNTLGQMAVMMRSPEFQGIVRKCAEDAIRAQMSNPNGEGFGRVIQASNSSIQQNGAKFVDWAKQGAQQAK